MGTLKSHPRGVIILKMVCRVITSGTWDLTNKVDSMIAETNGKMSELIDEYNTKYEDNDEVYPIETADLDSLFDQLADYINDHQ